MMLERQALTGGVVVYVSPLLREAKIHHAFSTRLGGTSPAPFDSMNLGNPNGCAIQDEYPRIWENYRVLQKAVGFGEGELCRVHQVHGDATVRAVRGEPFDKDAKADAIVSDDPSRVLSVRVADCVPVLLASHDGRMVAAVHAGWRGVVAGVVLQSFREMQVPANECLAAIGPCISLDAFEVGSEVLDEFERIFGPDAPLRRRADGKGNVNLREAIRRQLLGAGLAPSRIDTTDRCTVRDAGEFFSHRRDQGVTGRMAALIEARE